MKSRFTPLPTIFFFLFFFLAVTVHGEINYDTDVPYNFNKSFNTAQAFTIANYQANGLSVTMNDGSTGYILGDRQAAGDDANIQVDPQLSEGIYKTRVRVNSEGAVGNAVYGGFLYEISPSFDIINNSQICFNNTHLELASYWISFLSDDNNGFCVQYGSGYENIRTSINCTDSTYVTYRHLDYYTCINYTRLVDFYNSPNLTDINYLAIELKSTGTTNSILFDGLYAKDTYYDIGNSMPKAEILDRQSIYCLNETNPVRKFFLNMTDPENDTILWQDFWNGEYQPLVTVDDFSDSDYVLENHWATNGSDCNYSTNDGELHLYDGCSDLGIIR